MTEKIDQLLLGGITIIGGFFTKRIFSRQDRLEERIIALEQLILTKEDLQPITKNVDMILSHILNKK